jgi:hypothetical protein
MQGIVDRIEGSFYVIEIEGETTDVPRSCVAAGVRAGDVVLKVNEMWMKDSSATEKRSKDIQKLMDDIWED